MSRLMLVIVAVGMMGTLVMAQDRPRRDESAPPDEPIMVAQVPDGDFGPGGPGGRGPGGPGQPGPGGIGRMRMGPDIQKFEMLRAYIDTVDRFSKLASDPSTAAIAAVVSASDLLRQKGPAPAIEYFNKVLPEVKDAAVRRAIRLQLVDLYKASGETDKALAELETLMKGAAPSGSVPATP